MHHGAHSGTAQGSSSSSSSSSSQQPAAAFVASSSFSTTTEPRQCASRIVSVERASLSLVDRSMAHYLFLTTAVAVSAAASTVSGGLANADDPCLFPGNARQPFCNTKLSTAQRVKDLVQRLNMSEKLQLLNADGAANGIPRLGLPHVGWGTECLHGVVINDYVDPAGVPPKNGGGPLGGATVFPQPLLSAASFDRDLLHRIGEAIGSEARGLTNSNAPHLANGGAFA